MGEEITIQKVFRNEGFMLGRLLCESKSMYREAYPDNLVVFNANIVTVTHGKIWYGDLDITRDQEKLREIATIVGEPFFILKEMDGRFDNEDKSASELIKKAVWNTSEDVSVKK